MAEYITRNGDHRVLSDHHDHRSGPIYFGEKYRVGDGELLRRYLSECEHGDYPQDPEPCDERCSYWTNGGSPPQTDTNGESDPGDAVEGSGDRCRASTGTATLAGSGAPGAAEPPANCAERESTRDPAIVGPLNIIAAAIPVRWCNTCNRPLSVWTAAGEECGCSSDLEIVIDSSCSTPETDSFSSNSDSPSDGSLEIHVERKRTYKKRVDCFKNASKYRKKK